MPSILSKGLTPDQLHKILWTIYDNPEDNERFFEMRDDAMVEYRDVAQRQAYLIRAIKDAFSETDDTDALWLASRLAELWAEEYRKRYTEPVQGYFNLPTWLAALWWDNDHDAYVKREAEITKLMRHPQRDGILGQWMRNRTLFEEASLRRGDLQHTQFAMIAHHEFEERELFERSQVTNEQGQLPATTQGEE